jgi:hypothetical protein
MEERENSARAMAFGRKLEFAATWKRVSMVFHLIVSIAVETDVFQFHANSPDNRVFPGMEMKRFPELFPFVSCFRCLAAC